MKRNIELCMEIDNGFEKIIKDSTNSPAPALEKDIDNLQKKVQELEENRNGERFCWILALIIMLDCWAFSSFQNWGNAIVIGILEILLLTIIGSRLGIKDITLFTDKLLLVFNHKKT